MPNIKWADAQIIDDALGMGSGYLLDFSDKTMRNFFMSEFQLDLEQDHYRENGTSKGTGDRTASGARVAQVVGTAGA